MVAGFVCASGRRTGSSFCVGSSGVLGAFVALPPPGDLALVEHAWSRRTVRLFRQPCMAGIYRATVSTVPWPAGGCAELVGEKSVGCFTGKLSFSIFWRPSRIQPVGRGVPAVSANADLPILGRLSRHEARKA